MNLYIIGNGFDKAHGLKTDYWEFRNYLETKHLDFLLSFEKMYDIEWLDSSEYGYTEESQKRWENRVYLKLWEEFERFIGSPNIQSMLDYSTSVLNDMDLDSGNYGIKGTLDEHWRSEFGFVNHFQDYIKEWIINTVDLSTVKCKKVELQNNTDDIFLNFNYTNVLEEVYNVEDVLHIHGGIGEYSDYDPVMGHCNKHQIDEYTQYATEASEAYDEGNQSICEAVVDYLSSLYKDTDHYISINKWFFNKIKSVEKVIIFGWSAGEVDIPYLTQIRNSVPKNVEWDVYYFDQRAYDSLQNAFRVTKIFEDFKAPNFIQSEKFWDT